MPLDNRNRKPTQMPHVKQIIESNDPIPEVKPNVIDDVITLPTDVPQAPVEVPEDLEVPEVPEEVQEDDKEEAEVEDVKQEEDYKTKFKESSKESLNNFFKFKKLSETVMEASNIPDPTEDDLKEYAKVNGADYEDLDDFSKNILKKTLKNELAMGSITQVVQESAEIDKWVGKVDEYILSSQVESDFPTIAENAEAFKSYCMKSGRRGQDLVDLSASFLFNFDKPDAKKKSKSLFASQGNGKAKAEKPKVALTGEDLANLRINNPKEYRRLIIQKKAKLTI